MGFLPLLTKAEFIYDSSGAGRLPSAVARHKAGDLTIDNEPPLFVVRSGEVPVSAVNKNETTVKDMWLHKSSSLPELISPADNVRKGNLWLSGISAADSSRALRNRNFVPVPLDTLSSPGFGSPTNAQDLTGGWSLTSQGSRLKASKEDKLRIAAEKYPSLMWLSGQDGVDPECYTRACDRNFILLKIKGVLRHLEKVRLHMAQLLKAPPSTKFMTRSSSHSRPGSRGVSRGGPRRASATGFTPPDG
ncbi:unnamed protein product [Polarella glacialis]|uniref:Uncharacterized protein n=1 Tax=Polarella glacialis TaxID=89957 RepID=A0A813DTY2_POLGL|nr:unnamed protein product [Polarella glacialis]